MLSLTLSAVLLAAPARAQDQDRRPLKGKVSFALKRLDMQTFSMELPADFVDLLEVKVSNERAEEAGESNNSRFQRWVHGAVIADRPRIPPDDLAWRLKSCPSSGSAPLLSSRRISAAGVEGTQAVCGPTPKVPLLFLSAMLNSRSEDRHYSIDLVFKGLRYSPKTQAFLDKIVDSFRARAPREVPKTAAPGPAAQGSVPLLR
ncbi:MAG: hypothetical protein HYZ75_18780 [Elusimicrobia bacterium]|nr:hypothetical protein [Elusimicrobiota bacterium]